MASDLTGLIRSRVFRDNGTSDQTLRTVSARNSLSKLFSKHLKDSDKILEFRVAEADLPYVIEALGDDEITSNYEISQISPDTFQATPKVTVIF